MSLSIASIVIEPGMDGATLSLFKITFQVGATKIPQGFNLITSPYESNIVLIFQSKNGYENTLGTNQKNNTPINCAAGTGLAVTNKKKLNCRLKIGTTSEDLPEAQIFDYDEIAAGTTVTFYLAKIKTLDVGVTATISIGVRLYYKTKYGIVYLYKPIDYLPASGANTAFAGLAETTATVTFSGNAKVLSTINYVFTFTLTASVTATDYFALQFPSDMFDRNAESYSQVASSIAG